MNSGELKLSTEIYDIGTVKYAADKYGSVADISVSENDGYIVCSFSECSNGISETIREFENYVIYATSTGKKI